MKYTWENKSPEKTCNENDKENIKSEGKDSEN